MNSLTPQSSLISPEKRKIAIARIIDYFATEREEKIGIIAAEDLLKMFLDVAGNEIFNRGVIESKKLVKDRIQEIDFELELLFKDQH